MAALGCTGVVSQWLSNYTKLISENTMKNDEPISQHNVLLTIVIKQTESMEVMYYLMKTAVVDSLTCLP